MTLQAYAEPTLVRTHVAPQPLFSAAEPTMVRRPEASLPLYATAEPTMVRRAEAPRPLYATADPTMMRDDFAPLEAPGETPQEASQPARPSTIRTLGRIFDWTAISLMSLSVCAFICQQGFGVFTNG